MIKGDGAVEERKFNKYKRNDGKYYQAEGNDSYGQISLLSQNELFENKLGYMFKNFAETSVVAGMLQREFDIGYGLGKKENYLYDDTPMFGFGD